MSRDRLQPIVMALGVLLLLWGVVEIFRGEFDEAAGDFQIPRVTEQDADSVVFERVADTVVLVKQENDWTVNGHAAAPNGVSDFFEQFENAPPGQLVAQSFDTHGRLAIDDSTARAFRIFGNGETLAYMLVGKRARSSQESYFRQPGDASVYSVRTRIAMYVDRNVHDWRDRSIARIDTSVVSSAEIQVGSQSYVLRREDDGWQLGSEAADSAQVVTFLREYATITAMDFHGPDSDSVDFDQPDRHALLRNAAGNILVELAFDSTTSGYWVRKTGDSIIYRLSNFTVNRMTPSDSTLRGN
ncbi:MAG: DUF4340 domain-containing protein [Gemmatimonadetes bacterium]|nr:DUF4340 domain-containing protein [Gemmatimonadota bacterium]